MRPPSIAVRLTLLFSVTTVLTLVCVGLTFLAAIDRRFDALDLEELQGRAALVEAIVERAGGAAAPQALAARLDEAVAGQRYLSVALYDAGDQVVYATAGAEFPTSVLALAADSVDSARLDTWKRGAATFHGFALRLPGDGPSAGPLTLAIALEGTQHETFLAGIAPSLALVVGIALVGSLLAVGVAVRYGLAPLDRIASRTRGVTAGGLGERLSARDFPRELESLVNALNEMLGRLEAAFRKLSQFSSDLAHELRTPIANLITQTEVALAKDRCAADYREILYSNLDEFRRQARMVDDMLFLAKADHGMDLPNPQGVGLATQVDALLEFYEPLAERAGVRLVRTGEAHVQGDALMLRRAVGNLLANAIHHTAAGGTVTIALTSSRGEAVVQVSNPGATIAPVDLGRLFDRFFRVQAARQADAEGTGLGLAITKSIVEAHGGTITAASGAGRTTFTVVLPARAAPRPAARL